MNLDDIIKTLGILGAPLVALIGWVWRIGRVEQQLQDRMAHLEEEQRTMAAKVSDHSTRIFQRLDDLSQGLARAETHVMNISSTCGETRKMVMEIFATAVQAGAGATIRPEEMP